MQVLEILADGQPQRVSPSLGPRGKGTPALIGGAGLEARAVRGWRRYLNRASGTVLDQLADAQASFVLDALRNRQRVDRDLRPEYSSVLETASQLSRCAAAAVPSETRAFIAISPHLSLSKLMTPRFAHGLMNAGVNVRASVPHGEPWIWRHLPAWTVANTVGAVLVPVEMSYAHPIEPLQAAYGAIVLSRDHQQNLTLLIDQFRARLASHDRVVFSMFPEAGSTGKRQGGGRPFRLEPFRTGFVIAARRVGIPVLPIAHVVDPDGFSHVTTLDPIDIDADSDPNVVCDSIRVTMQREMRRSLSSCVPNAEQFV